MNNQKESSASLRGSPRSHLPSRAPSEDADRGVRPANQMPTALRREILRRAREARRWQPFAKANGLELKERYLMGYEAALVGILKWWPRQPRKASGGANEKALPPRRKGE